MDRFDVIFLISGIVSTVFLYFVHAASGSSNVLAKDPAYEFMVEHDHAASDLPLQQTDYRSAVSSDSQFGLSSGTQWRSRGS